MSIFASSTYDPIFIIEANFDGEMGPFWAQFDAAMGDKVREMIRCCKRPRDETGDLYDRVTAPGSRASLAAFLEARTQQPSVYFHGNRGLGRDRILQERALFRALQEEIDDPIRSGPSPYRLDSGVEAHKRLRLAMDARFPWLDEPAPRRISTRDSIMDYVRFFRFLVLALLVLSLPGVMLAPLVSWQVYLIIMAAGAAVIARLYARRKAVRGPPVVNRVKLTLFEPRRVLLFLAGVAVYAVLAVAVLSGAILAVHAVRALAFLFGLGPEPSLAQALLAAGRAVLLGLLSTVLTLPLLLYAVRYNELRDSSQDAPPVSERTLRDIARHEDWITQNHMGSIVLNKPGALRSVILRAGHYGLGLLLRVQPDARAGYLGSMRTVHFAHWAFLNNGSRLLFFSNFDHSWGSYLDDFIEKAHVGLTLAWGSSVGFPPTRMLLYDGASHGRQFKNWALASRAVSRFWYSAYPDLTVDQIERNHRIANGLRKRRISEEEAKAWMADL
ncbi:MULTISPECIES: hypothetical protein [Methylobacterium]|uniref:hypothetical protein n=1 Tax=Methylobacterium TaxID=407 RepID=UPI0013E9CD51|nr:hypothetical protein [Methylobacterium sp. DB0501]NGM35348.1 hypothetical protein [Methylobacterium sp. DB0501]